MKLRMMILATCVAAVATTAIAHKGATGVLLERMEGMLAMGNATKAVTPMMRGQEDYDPARTSEYASILQTHSGEAMLALFPEGLNAAPSVAKDEIWTNWSEFEAISDELALYALALDAAAPNGLGETAAAETSMMGDDASSMMGDGTSDMMGGAPDQPKTLETLASLSVSTLFAQTAQTCSACHSKFRAEE